MQLLHHGATVRFDACLKLGRRPDALFDAWYEFGLDRLSGLGAVLRSGRVDLHLQDGAVGDDDLEADGVVVDSGGPVVFHEP